MKNLLLLVCLITVFVVNASAQQVLSGISPTTNQTSEIINNYLGNTPENATLAYGNDANNGRFISLPIPAGVPWTQIATGYTDFIAGGDLDDNGNYYGCYFGNITNPQLVTVNLSTGVPTVIGPLSIAAGQSVSSLAFNTINDTWYLGTTDPNTLSSGKLYSVNVSTAQTTFIGDLTNCPGILALAISCDGNAYGIDAFNDNLVSISLSTAAGTIIGSLGVDVLFAQDADFDPDNGTLYWAGYKLLPPFDETGFFATINTSTGAVTEIVDWGVFAQITGFAVNATCQIVPVELGSFSANVNGNEVVLNWNTVTESNNSGFSVERMNEGEEFESVGFVPGFGTTTEPMSYSYVDNSLNAGKYSYKLKQIDFDGSFEYSNIVEVEVTNPSEYMLAQNYPNPFNPATTVSFSIPNSEFVNLTVYNSLGQEVAVLINNELSAGSYNVNFDARDLASGIYIAKLTAGSFTDLIKMNLLK